MVYDSPIPSVLEMTRNGLWHSHSLSSKDYQELFMTVQFPQCWRWPGMVYDILIPSVPEMTRNGLWQSNSLPFLCSDSHSIWFLKHNADGLPLLPFVRQSFPFTPIRIPILFHGAIVIPSSSHSHSRTYHIVSLTALCELWNITVISGIS